MKLLCFSCFVNEDNDEKRYSMPFTRASTTLHLIAVVNLSSPRTFWNNLRENTRKTFRGQYLWLAWSTLSSCWTMHHHSVRNICFGHWLNDNHQRFPKWSWKFQMNSFFNSKGFPSRIQTEQESLFKIFPNLNSFWISFYGNSKWIHSWILNAFILGIPK